MQATETTHTRNELLFLCCLFAICLLFGVGFFAIVEGLTLVDAFFFTSMILTTVGHGDISPQTDLGKIVTSLYAIVGIGFFLGFANVIFHNMMIRSRRWRR